MSNQARLCWWRRRTMVMFCLCCAAADGVVLLLLCYCGGVVLFVLRCSWFQFLLSWRLHAGELWEPGHRRQQMEIFDLLSDAFVKHTHKQGSDSVPRLTTQSAYKSIDAWSLDLPSLNTNTSIRSPIFSNRPHTENMSTVHKVRSTGGKPNMSIQEAANFGHNSVSNNRFSNWPLSLGAFFRLVHFDFQRFGKIKLAFALWSTQTKWVKKVFPSRVEYIRGMWCEWPHFHKPRHMIGWCGQYRTRPKFYFPYFCGIHF